MGSGACQRYQLIQPLSPQAYLKKWQRLQRIRTLGRRYQNEWGEPVMIRLDPQRMMSQPLSGWKLTMWRKQQGRCQYCCGWLLPRFHVDHIHPKSKGGANHPSNYCLACQLCNLSKHDKSAMDFTLSLLGASSL